MFVTVCLYGWMVQATKLKKSQRSIFCLFVFCCKDQTNKEILTGKQHAAHQGQDNRVTDESKPQEQDRQL